jgi:hypothetical protein
MANKSVEKHKTEKAIKKHLKKTKPPIGITKGEFFVILDKASQPVKHEAQSDSEKSET